MKRWLKSLSKEQVQRYVFVGLLVLVFAAFFISLSIANDYEKNDDIKDPIENPNDSNSNNNNDSNGNNNNSNGNVEKPEETPETLGMPIKDDFVVVRKYYDIEGSEEAQELAVIQFGKRYYTSNGIGVSSSSNTDFEVLAVLSGEVVSVDESPIYGLVVTMKHDNGLITEYSSLQSVSVKAGDSVTRGSVLGVSGICEYDSALDSHVFLKVMSDTTTYNPEEVIGKTIEEILK